MTNEQASKLAHAMRTFRDPMSKTLAISMTGILSLTVIGAGIIAGGIATGTLAEASTIALIGNIVTGIVGCVTAVASRAQAPSQLAPAQKKTSQEQP